MTLTLTATRGPRGFYRVRNALQGHRDNDGCGLRFDLVDAIRLLFWAVDKATVQVPDGDGGSVVVAWRPRGAGVDGVSGGYSSDGVGVFAVEIETKQTGGNR